MIPGWHSDFWTPSVFKNLLRKPPLCPAEVRDRKENLAFGYFLGAQLFLFVLRSAARKRSELLEVPARLERTSFGSENCRISYVRVVVNRRWCDLRPGEATNGDIKRDLFPGDLRNLVTRK
jgi:hypothetical protein